MNKRLAWITLEEGTDLRDVISTGNGTVEALLGPPLVGWGDATHTVMATSPSNPYARPAHAKLTEEEAGSLPRVETLQDYITRFEI
jgi:hypothetical protein